MDEDEVERLLREADSAEELRSTHYEEVTATILEHKLQRHPAVHTVTHDHDLQCDFGEKQMDVVLEVGDGEDAVTIIVECKGRGCPMEKDDLASFAFYLEYSDADQGIYVSRSGFRKGAKQIAEECDIQLFEITLLGEFWMDHVEGMVEAYPTPTIRDQIGMIRVEDGTPANLGNLVSTGEDMRKLDVLDANGDPTGDTLADRLPDEIDETGEVVTTEFDDGERVQVDGDEYTLHSAESTLMGGDSDGEEVGSPSTFELKFDEWVELKLRDVLADDSEYIVLDEIKDRFIDVETSG